jgi:hypothetical protein
MAAQASLTVSTWRSGLQSHTVSDFERGDGRSDAVNHTRGFMTQDHGLFERKLSNGSLSPVVDVTAADAGVRDLNENIMGGLQSWDGTVFIGDLEWLMKNKGRVLLGLSAGVPMERMESVRGTDLVSVELAMVIYCYLYCTRGDQLQMYGTGSTGNQLFYSKRPGRYGQIS